MATQNDDMTERDGYEDDDDMTERDGYEDGMRRGQRDYMRGEWNPAMYRTSRRSSEYEHQFSAGYHDAGRV